jgi:hypothetical protein
MTPRETFLAYAQALDRGDLAAMSSLLDENFRLDGAGLDGIGKADFQEAMKAQMTAFPDYAENPTDIEERGDRVSFVAHVTGTQLGTLALPGMDPVEATGRAIRAAGASLGASERWQTAGLSR